MYNPNEFRLMNVQDTAEQVIQTLQEKLSDPDMRVYDRHGLSVKPSFTIFDDAFCLKPEFFLPGGDDESQKTELMNYELYLLDRCIEQVFKLYNNTIANQFYVEEKVALLLMHSTFSVAGSRPTLPDYAIAMGSYSPENPQGLLMQPFGACLERMGPYIFYRHPGAVGKKDSLMLACEQSDKGVVREFLGVYAKKVGYYRALRNDNNPRISNMSFAATFHFNAGVLNAIKYVLGEDRKNNNKGSLVSLFIEEAVKDCKLFDEENRNLDSNDGLFSIEQRVAHHFRPGESNLDLTRFNINSDSEYSDTSSHASLKLPVLTPPQWGLAVFMVTAVAVFCVGAGLWQTTLLDTLFEKLLNVDNGGLKTDDKVGLSVGAVFVPSLITGAVAYAVAKSHETPKQKLT